MSDSESRHKFAHVLPTQAMHFRNKLPQQRFTAIHAINVVSLSLNTLNIAILKDLLLNLYN